MLIFITKHTRIYILNLGGLQKQAHKRESETKIASCLACSLLSLWIFVLGVKVYLVFGWRSLLVQHRGSLLHFSEDLLSFFGGLLNLLIDISSLGNKIFSFSELHLLHSLLDFSHMSFSLGKNLLMLLFALLETMIMLDEDFFGFGGN